MDKEISRLINWILIPLWIINLIIMIVVPKYRMAGFIYLAVGGFAFTILNLPRFKEEIHGIDTTGKSIFISLGVGIGAAVLFLVVTYIAPFFSLLAPTLPYAIGSEIRKFIIIAVAPNMETALEVSLIAIFLEIYKLRFWISNVLHAVIFAVVHLAAYGVFLESFRYWFEVYGAVLAISGSLLAAFVFALISGAMIYKFKSVLPSIIAHMIINTYLIIQGLIIVS